MIASTIGRTFLNAYNEKFKKQYSAKDFFVEIYHKLFYDHNKYMMSGGNSDLENGPKISWDKMLNGQITYETKEERQIRFNKLIKKITTTPANMSTAIGFPALGVTATTSGQVTNIELPFKEEDVYLSWIGSGFGIGVEGGLSMLFGNVQILFDLFEGWAIYRQYLNDTPQLRGNQINTWNGQWISHRYDKRTYDEQHPTASFDPLDPMKGGGMEVKIQSWTKVLLGIARNFPDSLETAYVYSLGKANITIGFVPLELPKIRMPYELYMKYFGTVNEDMIENLFGTAFGFTKACQMGVIGVNALEPKGLRDYLNKGNIPKCNNEDEEKKINFNTYQIWLLAMLNNENLWDISLQIAQQLNEYKSGAEKARVDRKTKVENLLVSIKRKQFLENLIPIIAESESGKLEEIGKTVHFMPEDNFPYFSTLIRFQYACLIHKK
jgi:hypothetical protein